MKNPQIQISTLLKNTSIRRGAFFGFILLGALLSFEVFNYSTTDFALTDLLGPDLKFLGFRWATILSIAFCGIDFAGIARLFTPEQGKAEPAEVWYLFGAWVLAAAMNAILTWWGVSVAVRNHQALGSAIVSQQTLLNVAPVFVAIMVWLIRILIIGTFSMAGERLFSIAEDAISRASYSTARPAARTTTRTEVPANPRPTISNPRPAPRNEPSYHPVGMAARSSREDNAKAWR